MSISRRRFLGYTAGVVTAGLRGLPLDPTSRRYVLLDLHERGCFRESVAGFESALTSAGAQWMRADARWMSPSRCAVLIVPAALEIPPSVVRVITSCLQAGAGVIFESGAGLATDREFRAHRVVPRRRHEGEGEVIAWVDDLPVALKRPGGRGNLIFLGSPLGPALWAGDAEARRWLVDCLRTAGAERA